MVFKLNGFSVSIIGSSAVKAWPDKNWNCWFSKSFRGIGIVDSTAVVEAIVAGSVSSFSAGVDGATYAFGRTLLLDWIECKNIPAVPPPNSSGCSSSTLSSERIGDSATCAASLVSSSSGADSISNAANSPTSLSEAASFKWLAIPSIVFLSQHPLHNLSACGAWPLRAAVSAVTEPTALEMAVGVGVAKKV